MDKAHKDISLRISKVAGMLTGIQRMVEDGKPFPEVSQQIRAAHGALRRTELEIMRIDMDATMPVKRVSELIERIWKFAN